jgi:hypothetical protein
LRAFQEEANCLYETQCIREVLDQDPFQCYTEQNLKQTVQQFQQSLQVVDCHRLEKDDNYCLIQAIVKCHGSSTATSPKAKKQKRQSQQLHSAILLHFRYERIPATNDTATSIWYSIDLSQNHGPKENILTIRCWADDNTPSRLPAVCIDDKEVARSDNDGEWEDIDDDENEEGTTQPDSEITEEKEKEFKVNGKTAESTQPTHDNACNKQDSEEPQDRYACVLDPDVLLTFQTCSGLTEMDQAAGFFTLMAFPFYQQEWDLVGFVLDSVFAHNNEDEDEED